MRSEEHFSDRTTAVLSPLRSVTYRPLGTVVFVDRQASLRVLYLRRNRVVEAQVRESADRVLTQNPERRTQARFACPVCLAPLARLAGVGYAAVNGEMSLIFPLMFRAASQRSIARWAFNQNSGLLPNNRESRNAISGLTARRSRSNSFTVWRDTRRDLANPDTVKPYSGRKSPRNILPGCVGRTFRSRVLGMLIVHLSSMVIGYFYVVGVARFKSKAYSPLVVDGNRILPGPLALQFVQSIARRRLQIVHARREIKIFQLAQRPLPHSGRNPLGFAAHVQLLRTFVGKGLDHARSVTRYVTPVNHGPWLNTHRRSLLTFLSPPSRAL